MAKDTVTVTALKYHTHAGQEYHEGDTYEVSPDAADNLVAIRFVHRTETPPPARVKASAPVAPMTTDTTRVPTKPTKPTKASKGTKPRMPARKPARKPTKGRKARK